MQIRPATLDDAAPLARLHVDTWRVAYCDILPAAFLDALSYEKREQRWCDRLGQSDPQQFTLVAEEPAGVLVGFASGGPERDGTPGYDGEVYALYVSPSHWRSGIGRRLMVACAQMLLERGFRSGMLWVLEENQRARAFYEALGGQLLGSKSAAIGEIPVVEVAYGWPDLAVLCSS